MPSLTSANMANAIVKLVAVKALEQLTNNLVMGALVNRDFEPTLAQAGDTINVPIPPTLVANDIADGAAVVTQAVNLGNAQIVLNKHKEATVQLPDVTKALSFPGTMDAYMGAAVTAIAEAIEGDLLGLYSGFTANTAVGTGGTALVESVVDAAETALFNSKVPQTQPRNLVVNGSTYGTLRQIGRFSEVQTVGNPSALVTGQVLNVKGFNVYRSQGVKQTGSLPTTTQNIAFHRNAIGLVIRRLPQPLAGSGAIVEYAEAGNFGLRVVMSYQPNTLAQQFTVDVLYGCGILRNDHGIVVRS